MLREKSLFHVFMVLLFFTWSGCGGGGGGNSTPATTTTQTPSNIAGTWRGTLTSSVLSGNINAEVTFSQSGGSVSGTLACYSGTLNCAHSAGNVTGTVSGSSVSLTIQFADNQTCTVSNASISSSAITGQYDCQNGDKGIFAVNKAATSSQTASLEGTWKGTATSSASNGTLNLTLTLSQSDTSLSGTYSCAAGTLACVHTSGNAFGTVSGDALTVRIVFSDTHSCGTFNTTVSGNTMSGQGSCDDPLGEAGSYGFTLTKQSAQEDTVVLAGTSPNEGSFIKTSDGTLIQVTGVTASPQADNKIRVSWQPVTYSKLAGYVVYRAEDTGGAPGQFVCAGEVSPGVQFFDDEGKTCGESKEKKEALVTGKSYWYQVGIKTTWGEIGGLSKVDNSLATVGAKAKPKAPTVNPPKPSGGKAIMSWTPPTTRSDAAATALLSSEILGYWVYYSTDSTNFTVNSRTFFAHTVGSTQISATVKGLTNNAQYFFVVSTVDTDQQESAPSGKVTATPVASPPPKAPEWTKKCAATITNTAIGEVDDPACSLVPKSTRVELKWKSVIAHKDGTCYKDDTGCATTPYEDILTGYRIYRIASTTIETDRTKYSLILSPTKGAGQEMSVTDAGVTNDTTYFYYVRAINDEGTQSDLAADNSDILGPVTPKGSSSP